MTKICRICKEKKPISDFYFRKDKNVYRTECRKCQSALSYSTDRYKKLEHKYGITKEEYFAKLEEQNGVCKICGKEKYAKREKHLHVDHCHITGKVRGLLCSTCNNGIGKFYDSIDLLLKAIEYLKEYKD